MVRGMGPVIRGHIHTHRELDPVFMQKSLQRHRRHRGVVLEYGMQARKHRSTIFGKHMAHFLHF